MEPHISRDILIRAAEMDCNGFTAFKAKTKTSGRLVYVIPRSDCPEEKSNYEFYQMLSKKEWQSFDQYIKYGFQLFWLVQFDSVDWNIKSRCTCPVFFKENVCKHLIAIALKQRVIECPQIANPLLIAPRKQQGRPKNATKSLQRD